MPAYATADDLAAFVPATITVPDEPEATRLLTHASEAVDGLLLTALYDTDDDGLPTDAEVIVALRDATCAQALWWLETGDEDGAQGQYQSVSIGSVSLTRAGAGSSQGVTTSATQTVSSRASEILRLAGLLQQGPLVC
jgi:hypothetical protein